MDSRWQHLAQRNDAANNANDAAAQNRFATVDANGTKTLTARGFRFFAKHPKKFDRWQKRNS
ncbi:MAG TPA: hypothetical protein VK846_00665 [Candidatus Limnocylindria bacterium]|nr:hypothetical protein [Candidatus Limnocylindria bacterium]